MQRDLIKCKFSEIVIYKSHSISSKDISIRGIPLFNAALYNKFIIQYQCSHVKFAAAISLELNVCIYQVVSDIIGMQKLQIFVLPQGPPRTSSLQAPIMLMSGHEGEVYCCKFHPNGATLASSGFDRLICKSWPKLNDY